MSFEINDTILQRFHVIDKEQIDDVIFGHAFDAAHNIDCHLISPAPNAQIRQGAVPYFEQVHNAQNPSPIWQGTHNKSLIAIYDTPLHPIKELPSLSLEEGEQLLHNLLGQLQKNPNAFLGGVRLSDMGCNEEGHLILRASGVIPKENHALPQIEQSTGTPLQKALYSIGVHIFSMVSQLPLIQNKNELALFQQNPPSLQISKPNVSPDFAHRISLLMHPNPPKREEALINLQEREALPLSLIQKKVSAPVQHKILTPLQDTRRDLPLPQWLVFCKEKSIPLSIARRLAIFSEIDAQAIIQNSHSIPLAGADTETEAQKIANQMNALGITTYVRSQKSSSNLSLFLGGGVALGITSWVLSFGLFLTILPIIFGVFGSMALGFFQSNTTQQLYKKWNETHAPVGTAQNILLGRKATQEARKAIINSHLPDLAQIDTHNALDEIDDILDDYHETKSSLPTELLAEISSTCANLIQDIQQADTKEHSFHQIRKQSQLVQKLARQMRSL